MSEHNWSEFTKIKSDYDLNAIKLLFNNLKSLLNSFCLQNEYKILISVLKRIAIRLRSAKVTRLIKITKRYLDRLFDLKISDIMIENISTLVKENYDISSGCIVLPFRQQIDSVLKVFIKSAPILKKLILISMNTFSHCHQWLRSGNLAPHFLMMSSCLSRFHYISKAILVYVSDLYLPLISIKDVLKEKQLIFKEVNSFPESLEEYLTDLNIKCEEKVVKTNDQIITNKTNDEDIGVPIKRIESKQQTNENKPKAKKKKKNKNNLNIKPKQELNQKLNKIKPKKQINVKKKKRKN